MKDLARLLAAALFGAAIAVEASAVAQAPTHLDVRFDRLERGMDVLASQLADVDREVRNCANH